MLDEVTDAMPTTKSTHQCRCPECLAHPRGKTARLHTSINRLAAALDEKHRRQFVGLWAAQLGHGGIQRMARITGLDRNTIARGQRELIEADPTAGRIRAPGAGRPRVEKKAPASQRPCPK